MPVRRLNRSAVILLTIILGPLLALTCKVRLVSQFVWSYIYDFKTVYCLRHLPALGATIWASGVSAICVTSSSTSPVISTCWTARTGVSSLWTATGQSEASSTSSTTAEWLIGLTLPRVYSLLTAGGFTSQTPAMAEL